MKSTFAIVLCLALGAVGCKNYSTVTEIQPTYESPTLAGEMIATANKQVVASPLARLGQYLDAANTAGNSLRSQPRDSQALADYDFAVSRIFEILHNSNLEPWKDPLKCPGATKVWNLSFKRDPRPERNPSNFKIEPSDIYEFTGDLVKQRVVKEGLGAPLVVTSKQIDPANREALGLVDRVSYGMTGVIDFNGNKCVGRFIDPLASESVRFNGHYFPLAADFTAPLALAIASSNTREEEIAGLFGPGDLESDVRLARLQPYDPNKIPILCIHGLGDSQATWVPMIQALRGDATIRKNYQIWFFSYPTCYPYLFPAASLRKRMDEINERFPRHKKMVVIGHSMGGMISRTLMTDSGMTLWNAIYEKPPSQMPFSKKTRKVMTDSLIFKPRRDISRVIFMSPSHRGAELATSFLGKLGSLVIGSPDDIVDEDASFLAYTKPDKSGEQVTKLPNSIDLLNPEGRIVTTIADIPLKPGIPYHTIIGDRGKGGNLSYEPPVSTDGIVPYWSSHLDGAQSEVIIPSDHWTNHHPDGIAEVNRILHEHLKKQ